jgi:hypothetical protein
MKRKVVFLIAFALLLSFSATKAQPYKTGLGVRLGTFSGLTVKHFVSSKNALEGILSFRWGGTAITGLYEWQKQIKGAPGLDWEIGLGGHIGFWDSNKYYWARDNSSAIVGLDFILGLEYTFKDAPFSIGLDWKPAFNIIGDDHWWSDGAALSIRYNF